MSSSPGHDAADPSGDSGEVRRTQSSSSSDGPMGISRYDGPPIGVAVLGTGQRALSLTTKLHMCSAGSIKFVLYDEVPRALEEARAALASWKNEDEIETVDSVAAAVCRPDVQWVMVTSKNYLHKDYCVAALEAGKHVFCEKPLATTIDDCLTIKEAAVKAGKLFMTGFVLRYSPFYSEVSKLVKEGFLGKIVSMEANEMLAPDHGGYIFRNWRRFKDQSGPHILEKCAHDVDILNWMADSVVTKASAFGGTDIFTAENKAIADKLQEESASYYTPMYKGWGTYEDADPFTCEKTVEDNIVTVLQYRNGIRVTFQTNCCSAIPQRQLKIFGIEGSLDGDSMTGQFVAKRMSRGSKEVKVQAKGGQHAGGDPIIVATLWNAMVSTAKQNAGEDEGTSDLHIKSSLEECFISSITCLAIDEARVTGTVVDLEKYWERLGI